MSCHVMSSYHTISYHIILYYIMLYYVILYYIILYYIILYYIILYYIISYYIIIVRPPSYMRSVVDRNVFMRRMIALPVRIATNCTTERCKQLEQRMLGLVMSISDSQPVCRRSLTNREICQRCHESSSRRIT